MKTMMLSVLMFFDLALYHADQLFELPRPQGEALPRMTSQLIGEPRAIH